MSYEAGEDTRDKEGMVSWPTVTGERGTAARDSP